MRNDYLALQIRIYPEHEAMLDAIVAGAKIKGEQPGNQALIAALCCAARVAREAQRGATQVEFFGSGKSMTGCAIEALWKPPGEGQES